MKETKEETITNNEKEVQSTGFVPFHKIKKLLPIGQKTKVGIPKRPTDKIKEYIRELDGKQTIDMTNWTPIKEQLDSIDKKGNEWEEEKIKEPILILIRSGTNKGEVFENIKAGNLKIRRTDGKMATIKLLQTKLISFDWGGNTIKGWIANEEDCMTYPLDAEFDSARVREHFENSLVNTKNFEAQTIRAWEGMAWAVVGGIVLIILAIGFLSMMGIKMPWEQDTTTQHMDIQTNENGEIQTINGQNVDTVTINTTGLTEEQKKQIEEITGKKVT